MNFGGGFIAELELVGTSEIAHILGLSARRVQQMVEDGTLPYETVGKRRKFSIPDAVQAYINSISDRNGGKDDNGLETEKLEQEVRFKTAKANIADMEWQELNGEMHRSEDVQAMMEDFSNEVRTSFLSLPGRIAVEVSQESEPAACADSIRKEACSILEHLSTYQYDPAKFRERVRSRLGKKELQEDAEEEESE